MPERARVFVAEDNLQYQGFIEKFLSRAGHTVVLKATTLDEALDAIKQFEDLGVQVATIDGNLSPDDESGYDGHALVEAIGRHAPNVKTVGMSGLEIKGVTIDLGKKGIDKLGEVVTNL